MPILAGSRVVGQGTGALPPDRGSTSENFTAVNFNGGDRERSSEFSKHIDDDGDNGVGVSSGVNFSPTALIDPSMMDKAKQLAKDAAIFRFQLADAFGGVTSFAGENVLVMLKKVDLVVTYMENIQIWVEAAYAEQEKKNPSLRHNINMVSDASPRSLNGKANEQTTTSRMPPPWAPKQNSNSNGSNVSNGSAESAASKAPTTISPTSGSRPNILHARRAAAAAAAAAISASGDNISSAAAASADIPTMKPIPPPPRKLGGEESQQQQQQQKPSPPVISPTAPPPRSSSIRSTKSGESGLDLPHPPSAPSSARSAGLREWDRNTPDEFGAGIEAIVRQGNSTSNSARDAQSSLNNKTSNRAVSRLVHDGDDGYNYSSSSVDSGADSSITSTPSSLPSSPGAPGITPHSPLKGNRPPRLQPQKDEIGENNNVDRKQQPSPGAVVSAKSTKELASSSSPSGLTPRALLVSRKDDDRDTKKPLPSSLISPTSSISPLGAKTPLGGVSPSATPRAASELGSLGSAGGGGAAGAMKKLPSLEGNEKKSESVMTAAVEIDGATQEEVQQKLKRLREKTAAKGVSVTVTSMKKMPNGNFKAIVQMGIVHQKFVQQLNQGKVVRIQAAIRRIDAQKRYQQMIDVRKASSTTTVTVSTFDPVFKVDISHDDDSSSTSSSIASPSVFPSSGSAVIRIDHGGASRGSSSSARFLSAQSDEEDPIILPRPSASLGMASSHPQMLLASEEISGPIPNLHAAVKSAAMDYVNDSQKNNNNNNNNNNNATSTTTTFMHRGRMVSEATNTSSNNNNNNNEKFIPHAPSTEISANNNKSGGGNSRIPNTVADLSSLEIPRPPMRNPPTSIRGVMMAARNNDPLSSSISSPFGEFADDILLQSISSFKPQGSGATLPPLSSTSSAHHNSNKGLFPDISGSSSAASGGGGGGGSSNFSSVSSSGLSRSNSSKVRMMSQSEWRQRQASKPNLT